MAANPIYSYALVQTSQVPGMCLKPQHMPVVQKLHLFSLQIETTFCSNVSSAVLFHVSLFSL
jgi:hypothetical protein